MIKIFLTFSDSAKYADVARNFVLGRGWGTSFSFWTQRIFEFLDKPLFQNAGILPFHSLSIAFFFKIFGISDFAVIATSFFYFLLTLIFVFLLGKKIFNSKLVGILSILAVGFNYDLIHYAVSGASESPFIFEIAAASYFASLKKKWTSFVTVLFLVLMYFTRPQAFIYIAGIILYWLLINFKPKKTIITFGALVIAGLLIDRLVLWPLSGKFFLYSIIGRGLESSFNQSSVASDALRGAAVASGGITQTLKNIFYNLYNFYKLLPQILNPYLFALFAIGLFIAEPKKTTGVSPWDELDSDMSSSLTGYLARESGEDVMKGKDKIESSFKVASLFMVVVTFLVTAASIPFFRYLHPIIPLVYVLAVGTLVKIISKFEYLNSKQIPSNKSQKRILDLGFKNLNLRISKQLFINLESIFLILIFVVGQTLGILLLDSRFEARTHNIGKPPVYVELSKILKENTEPNQVIVTNLDTWGSWYGERKTVWFPLEPKQLIDLATGTIPFDAIYLTSYKIDDANYYMGQGWRMIFENPTDSKKWTCEGCGEIAREYTLKGIYKINSADDYERRDASAILLVKIPNYKSQIPNYKLHANSKNQVPNKLQYTNQFTSFKQAVNYKTQITIKLI
jgi:hypothetical protein